MRILDQHYDGITMGDVVWHSKWETWVRLADTFREGGIFLAGDSAHVHSTNGSQAVDVRFYGANGCDLGPGATLAIFLFSEIVHEIGTGA